MSDTSGPTYGTPFAWYDLNESCWRTSQGTFPWDSGTYSETWPASGMTRGGESFELPTWAHRTGASGSSSLLPTPKTTDENTASPADANRNSPRLRAIDTLLPTPVADHSRGLPQPGTDFQSLPNVAVSLLPTPAVNDMGAGKTVEDWDAWTQKMQEAHGNGNGHGKSLSIEAAKLLPTPSSQEPGYTGQMVDGSGNPADHVAQRVYHPETGRLIQTGLPQAVALLNGEPTGQPSPDGKPSSDDAPQHQLSLDETDHD